MLQAPQLRVLTERLDPIFSERTRRALSALASIIVPGVAGVLATGLNLHARYALAVALFMVLSWMTEWIPHALTGLLGCFLFWALGVTKIETAFSGFTDSTTWFYFGSLLIGMLATETGLSRRVALQVLIKVGNSYSNLLLGFIVLSFILAFLIPSGVACVVIKAAIAIGLMQAYGLSPGSNVGRALFITLTYTSGLFDKMILAGTASILGRGLIAKSTGIAIPWSQWLLAYLPLEVLTIVIMWRFLVWLYPPEISNLGAGETYVRQELTALGPRSKREIRAFLMLLTALLLWMTDSLHHVEAAMIGLGIGLLALLPGIGVLDFDTVKVKLNYMSVFFVAAALSLSAVLISTKALVALVSGLFAWMGPLMRTPTLAVLVTYTTALVYHLFLGSELTMLSTSIAPLMDFAKQHHVDPIALGMLWTFASGGKLFVYQSAPMIVGYSFGYFSALDMLKVGGFLCILEGLLVVLIVPWYWPLIGI